MTECIIPAVGKDFFIGFKWDFFFPPCFFFFTSVWSSVHAHVSVLLILPGQGSSCRLTGHQTHSYSMQTHRHLNTDIHYIHAHIMLKKTTVPRVLVSTNQRSSLFLSLCLKSTKSLSGSLTHTFTLTGSLNKHCVTDPSWLHSELDIGITHLC